jgi:hypothetical protein
VYPGKASTGVEVLQMTGNFTVAKGASVAVCTGVEKEGKGEAGLDPGF